MVNFSAVFLIFSVVIFFFFSCQRKIDKDSFSDPSSEQIISSTNLFGVDTSNFIMLSKSIKRNEFLAKILSSFNLESYHVAELANKVDAVFDLRKVRFGKNYYALGDKNKARLIWTDILKSDQANSEVKNLLSYL